MSKVQENRPVSGKLDAATSRLMFAVCSGDWKAVGKRQAASQTPFRTFQPENHVLLAKDQKQDYKRPKNVELWRGIPSSFVV